MSLKVVLSLIIAGLVSQSSGFAVKRLRKDTTPGFEFTSEKNDKHEKQSVSAPEGYVNLPGAYLENVTAWTINPSNEGSTSISQNVNFYTLGVWFDDIQAYVGDELYRNGHAIYAGLNNAIYSLTLDAKRDGSVCALETKITPQKQNVVLWMLDLFNVDEGFLTDEVKGEMEPVVWKAVAEAVTGPLKVSFEKNLPDLLNTNDLCELILTGKVDEIPELKF